MAIHLYTIGWNEMRMLGFFFRHYETWVDRFVFFDDGSDDGTVEFLQSKSNVDVRRFSYNDPESFSLSARAVREHCWKESRGIADWVILADVDEHIYHPQLKGYLNECKKRGITYMPTLGFEMVTDEFPDESEYLARTRTVGAPNHYYNKMRILDPNAIEDINFGVGGHVASPSGHLVLPEKDELLLLHYKHLGTDYVAARHAALGRRLRGRDVANGWGYQYLYSLEDQQRAIANFKSNLVDITDKNYLPWRDHHEARWWRAELPRSSRVKKHRKIMHTLGLASSPQAEVEGHVDLITPRQIFGWVWDRSDPSRHLEVFVRMGTAELAQGSARFFRSDLTSAGIGDGSYAFYLHFPRMLSEEILRSIEIRVRGVEAFRFPILPNVTPVGPALFVPQHLKDFDATWLFAERIKGWLHREEGELLYVLARSSACEGRVVELGSYCGRSSIVLAAGVIAASVAPLVCVDTFGGSLVHQTGQQYFDPETLYEGVVNTYPIFLNNMQKVGLQGLVEAVKKSTVDAAGCFVDRVALLFVDAAHDYESVHADLEAWTPKLAEGAFIVLHDFGVYGGVTRGVADLLDANYRFHAQSRSAIVLRKP